MLKFQLFYYEAKLSLQLSQSRKLALELEQRLAEWGNNTLLPQQRKLDKLKKLIEPLKKMRKIK